MKIAFLILVFIFSQVIFEATGQNLVSNCPKCGQPADESRFHAYDDVFKRRWQTPAPGTSQLYQDSYQDYHSLVGYADIRYTDSDRHEADVCLVCIHRRSTLVHFTYYFDEQPQPENCRRFSSLSQKTSVRLRVEASDGTKLNLSPVNFIWNVQPVLQRPGDYRDGQKGAIVELFGWKFREIEQECELLGRAGYLGVKLCPVTEHIMSDRPENGALNPWYYVYQPVSYQFDCRYGTREDLESLVNTCRARGVRVYVDMVLNHFSGPVGSSCNSAVSGKKSSAPDRRQSPFFTHEHSGRVNPATGELGSYEYPGAAIGPEDFHCEKALDKWDDLNVLNTGWLSGLADVNTTRENVRARQSAYIVELLSMGVSGFRLDAAKHMSPDDLAAVFKLVQRKMGGRLPSDFIAWLEVLTGSQAYVLWDGPSWYGHHLADLLADALGSDSEVDKIKLFDSGYPVRPWENRAVASNRVVIQNDDHDSQSPVFYRDLGDRGCVLVKGCPPEQHRYYETRLFVDPYEVRDPAQDWPIRILLSSFYHTHGVLAVPDGLSDCSRSLSKRSATTNSDECVESVGYFRAAAQGKCAYAGDDYTRVHRDVEIINAMRAWMRLEPARLTGADIGLPNCQ